jgi:predicted nucleic acid-binding protein
MTAVFADTVFFLALLNEKDEFRERAVALSRSLRRPIVTTAWVLTELADGLADTPGRVLFRPFLLRLMSDPRAQVVPASQDLLDSGIELYHDRPDQEWSLTDCVSFLVMQHKGISEALTADHHFEQAGFQILLK